MNLEPWDHLHVFTRTNVSIQSSIPSCSLWKDITFKSLQQPEQELFISNNLHWSGNMEEAVILQWNQDVWDHNWRFPLVTTSSFLDSLLYCISTRMMQSPSLVFLLIDSWWEKVMKLFTLKNAQLLFLFLLFDEKSAKRQKLLLLTCNLVIQLAS